MRLSPIALVSVDGMGVLDDDNGGCWWCNVGWWLECVIVLLDDDKSLDELGDCVTCDGGSCLLTSSLHMSETEPWMKQLYNVSLHNVWEKTEKHFTL